MENDGGSPTAALFGANRTPDLKLGKLVLEGQKRTNWRHFVFLNGFQFGAAYKKVFFSTERPGIYRRRRLEVFVRYAINRIHALRRLPKSVQDHGEDSRLVIRGSNFRQLC
jgi:hypothetical protein